MFAGSTVVLTGVGGEGQLGEVVARAFAELGAFTVLVDHTAEKAEARAAAINQAGFSGRGYACDLTSAKEVQRLVEQVIANHGDKARALVHMVGGFAMSGPVADSSLDVWQRMIDAHLTTAYLTTRAFLPLVRAARGSIVLFASQAAAPGASVKDMSAYAVAKTGVAVLMRSVAAEERSNGVRANAIAPTAIRTAANVHDMGNDVRYVEREQVAAAVTFLCSDAASAITGELLVLS
jgi:NAD(P)-dependent dehydrogenase (short-subunit alcohol dehydrogenase family)